MVGYGDNTHSDTGAGVKRSATAPIVSRTSTDIHIGDSNTQTCSGDSGGPAFQTIGGLETIVGVTSFGTNRSATDICYDGSFDTRVDVSSSFIGNNLFGIGTTWNRWTTVSEGHAGPGVSVTVVPNGDGRYALFLADPAGGVYTALGNAQSGWTIWSPLPLGRRAGPSRTITAVANGDGRFAVFMADPSGEVLTTLGNAQNWLPWTTVQQGSAGAGTSVTAVAIGGGSYTLFVADPNGGVYTNTGRLQANGWAGTGWQTVQEGRAGPGVSVTAVPTGDGRFTLLVVDPGGGIFQNFGNSQSWNGWSPLQGAAAPHTSVTAVSTGGGQLALFVIGTDNFVYTTSGRWPTWSGWTRVSDGAGQTVNAIPTGDGRVGVFVSDAGRSVFTAIGSGLSWSAWSSVSSGNAGPGTIVTGASLGNGKFEVFVADDGGGVFSTFGPR
jgi:phosphatidylethanolamine-binding protein (PEBP) family uncharacterized protein